MDGSIAPSSPPLEAVTRRLDEWRAQKQTQRQVGDASPWKATAPSATEPNTATETITAIATLPAHLGWGSEAQTAILRRRLLRRQREANRADNDQDWIARLAEADVIEPSAATDNLLNTPSDDMQSGPKQSQRDAIHNTWSSGWVKLYPGIGLGMLRQELAAPGRLWLMLRYLDRAGGGTLRIDIIEQQLTQKTSTSKGSPLYLCGKRQLRNLLRDGEGIYWTRGKECIWLRSAAKVACALGVEGLSGRPVALPVSALLDGMGTFRAHLYAAFHSGRMKDTPRGSQAMPIARETMTELSGVGRVSQRAYEKRASVKVQANFAVGDVATKENLENRAWEQGQALFELKDYRGRQGKKGKTYLAWQLPNTYVGQHQQRPKGRQKRINRELKDLVMKGMPGNVGETSEPRQPEKVYYPTGKLAAKAYGRDPDRELYWRRHRTGNDRFAVWYQMEGE